MAAGAEEGKQGEEEFIWRRMRVKDNHADMLSLKRKEWGATKKPYNVNQQMLCSNMAIKYYQNKSMILS